MRPGLADADLWRYHLFSIHSPPSLPIHGTNWPSSLAEDGGVREGPSDAGLYRRGFLFSWTYSQCAGGLGPIGDEAAAVFIRESFGSLTSFEKAETFRQAQGKMV